MCGFGGFWTFFRGVWKKGKKIVKILKNNKNRVSFDYTKLKKYVIIPPYDNLYH